MVSRPDVLFAALRRRVSCGKGVASLTRSEWQQSLEHDVALAGSID
jgi:hypothetical protein